MIGLRAAAIARVACVVLGAGFSAVAADSGSLSNPAVPLRAPQLQTPVEAAGTGLAPEVDVRVELDVRGRVTGVEVLAIRPPSEFDAVFEAVTVETLSRWRYAPEVRDGQPVTTQLQWTIRFPTRRAQDEPEQAEQDPYGEPRRSMGRRGRVDPWRQILSLPDDQRRRLLDGIARSAESHLKPGQIQRASSRRFIVATDGSTEGLARIIAQNLEATCDVVTEIFDPLFEPRPDSDKIMAFVYATHEQFVALSNDALRVEGAAGFYNPAGLLAFHLELGTHEAVQGTMLHEATHAFVDRYMARAGVYLPRWLGEGFAEYVGNSVIKKRELIPGKTPKSQIYWRGNNPAMGRSEQSFGVELVRQALRKETAPTIRQLLDTDAWTFYGSQRRMFYLTSWLLVHFLRHGDGAWEDDAFPQFMLYVAEGYPVDQAFQVAYGQRPEDLEQRFREYVKRF